MEEKQILYRSKYISEKNIIKNVLSNNFKNKE